MKKGVRTEIDDLHQMAQNWKNSWLAFYSDDGVNEWIMEEFMEEIAIYILPYVRRLLDTNYLTEEDCGRFYEVLRGEIADLRTALRLPDKG